MKIPLRLRYEPIFDIKKDIAQIKLLPPADGDTPPFKDQIKVDTNVTPFPTCRAYILTKQLEPIAIFDRLDYYGFGCFINIVLCISPNDITPAEYEQTKVMNIYKQGIRNKWVKRPFKVAFFVANQLYYHLSVPIDLVLYLNVRFRENDIIDRQFWDFITECV